MRPPGPAWHLEQRRRQAIRLRMAGQTLAAVAQAVGASVSSVFRWDRAYRAQGLAGLRPRRTPGRPSKLSRAQQARLVAWLRRGARAAGYRTDGWTVGRIAQLIRLRCGVTYHPRHLVKLLARWGWRRQTRPPRALPRTAGRSLTRRAPSWPPSHHAERQGTASSSRPDVR